MPNYISGSAEVGNGGEKGKDEEKRAGGRGKRQ